MKKENKPDAERLFAAIAAIISQRGEAKVTLKGIRIREQQKAG